MPPKVTKGETNETASLKSDETTPRKPLDPWDKEARRVIKLEMLRAGHTSESLAELLKDSGYGTNTSKALAQRIVRGSFTFGFALRVLNAMGVSTLDLGYIDPKKHKKPR
jgi:hypothetical protein